MPKKFASKCRVWARVVGVGATPILFQPWNGLDGGDPATGEGGWRFDGPLYDAYMPPAQKVYLTAYGAGDASIQLFPSPDVFLGTVPRGFFGGWPTETGGGWTSFNPGTARGGPSFSNDNKLLGFGAGYGSAQSFDGFAEGRFYVEFQVGWDIFSNQFGLGVALKFDSPLDAAHPANGAKFISGGLTTNNAFGVALQGITPPQHGLGPIPNTYSIGLAIELTNDQLYPYVASRFEPVALPCIPCCSMGIKALFPF